MRPLRGAGAVVAAAVALCGAGCSDDPEPLRIGVLTECTGILKASGDPILAGAELPFLERGGRLRGAEPGDGIEGATVGGRPVEIVKGCTEVTGLTREVAEIRRLVEDEHVNVVIGPAGETEGVIASRVASRYPDVTFILGASQAQKATLSARPRPNVFRFGADAAQTAAGLATHARRDLGWRRATVVMDPVSAGWEAAAGFVSEFCALGGQVVERQPILDGLVPGGAAADRALGARLGRSGDDVMLISGFFSPASFLRGYLASGGSARRLVLNGFGFSLPGAMSSGGAPLDGAVIAGDVPLDSERPAWRRYRRAYARAFPDLGARAATDPLVLPSYLGAEGVARALERLDGDTGPHGRRLREALARVSFAGPAGPIRLDRDHQAIVSVHLRRVAGGGTRPFRIVKNVDQSYGGAFTRSTPEPSFMEPACRRGPVPGWARG